MRTYKGWQLVFVLLRHPTFRVILADDSDYPGSNWTDKFIVEYNHEHKCTILRGACT